MPNVTNFHASRNDSEWQESAKSLLRSFDCKITFQKPNGSINTVFGTLNPAHLPEAAKPKEVDSLLSLYDIDENKWKNIPYEKIINFKVETPRINSMN